MGEVGGRGGLSLTASGHTRRDVQQGLLPAMLPGYKFSSGASDHSALGVTTVTPGGGSPAPPCSGQRHICGIQWMHPKDGVAKSKGGFLMSPSTLRC